MQDEHERTQAPDPDGGGAGGERGRPSGHEVRVEVRPGRDEEHFRALTEHARDAIVEIGREGQLLYVSPAFTEIAGWTPAQVVGRSALELVHPDDVSEADAVRARVFAAELPAQLVLRFRHREGHWVFVELAARPYRTSDGEQRAVLVARDVGDRLRAERALQQQLDAERCIADLARRLLPVDVADLDRVLREVLESAARLADADRVQFYVVGRAGVGGHYGFEAGELFRRDPAEIAATASQCRWSGQRLRAGEIVHAPALAELPPEAAPEREALARDGFSAYLALPVMREGRMTGFFDCLRRRFRGGWSPAEITRLSLVAELLSGALRRLQAEGERRTAEERLDKLTRHARDTICEMSLSGRVLHISENFGDLCGYEASELAGMDPWSLVHPDDAEALRRCTAEAIRQGRDPDVLTYRIRHRDGGWRWLESSVRRFESGAGEPRLAVVVRDVTERQERSLDLEQELDLEKRVADFSRALLEQGANAIDAGIQSGLEIAAKLAGADRAYLITLLGGDGQRLTSYDWEAPGVLPRTHKFGPSDGQVQRWAARKLVRGEIVRIARLGDLPAEEALLRETLEAGGIRSFLALPILLEGRLIGVVGFHCLRGARDWSERELTLLQLLADIFTSALRRKRAEINLEESHHRLLQAQKMEAVGTLAGGIAHDFNNQLTVMLSNARFALAALSEREGRDPEVLLALEDLNRAANHCAQLTRSLLHFSRRTPVSPRALEVADVLTDSEELLRPLVPSSIQFVLRRPERPARVVADPTQLQQVLVNLVVNARDAMPDGGHLWLEAHERRVTDEAEAARFGLAAPGAYVEFSVRDSGHGMDSETRARIFEPFFTTKPLGQGTGLGLATAYGIVEHAGGSIAVESEPGRGSTFRVLLPQSLEPAPSVGADAAAGAGAATTVLVAEDEEGVRRLLTRSLRAAGYRVVEAPNGAEALRIGRQQAIDALVTDVDMPRMGGPELARRLTRRRPELPVLFISGTTGEDLLDPGPGSPHARSRFLAKPFSEDALLEALRGVLGRR
jgi:PAS domain S-box-containing protein